MLNKARSILIKPPVKAYKSESRLRIALVGMPGSGKTTIFNAVASAYVHTGELTETHLVYGECQVRIGIDEVSLVDFPSMVTLHHLQHDDLVSLQYLLWGNQHPILNATKSPQPTAPFPAPDVIIQVVDATSLECHLELSLELLQLGKPMVIALNMMDQASKKGLHFNIKSLQKLLGVPVVATTATMGHGIAELFDTTIKTARTKACPLPQDFSPHISEQLRTLSHELNKPEMHQRFGVSHAFLLSQIAVGDSYFTHMLKQHFPLEAERIQQLKASAEIHLPRPIEEELHADRHHQAATVFETATRLTSPHAGTGWRYWLDELFLSPRLGLVGSLTVFALVLFVVFEVSAWLDSISAAKLVEWISAWQPAATGGVIGRAVADGLIGLIGIVIPYMIPLVMLLVVLEESGIMHRIAFVVDRWFHHLGLHGGVALPFLLGLGCNVPALSATAAVATGRERIIASMLITFVPCSARSAVILALAGKYLGGLGIFAVFIITLIIIAIIGQILSRYYRETGPGQIQEIPDYALPQWRSVMYNTWYRTKDILTIVTPLLVGGSIILALLGHFGADTIINIGLIPISSWWLGLPVVLGVPILFGILRKELSLLMIYQALGTFDVGTYMDWVQIMTFLIFLTFYFPCVSTFAVMLKTIGYKNALTSVSLSIMVALIVSGAVRAILETVRYLLE